MLKLLVITLVLGFAQIVQGQVIDSLNRSIAFPDSLFSKQQASLDSIQAEASAKYGRLKQSFDSLDYQYTSVISQLQKKADSLTHLNLPTEKIANKVDSINRLMDDKFSSIKASVEKVKANTIGKIEQLNLPPELNDQVKRYTSVIDKLDITLPNTNIDIDLASLKLDANLDLSLPNLNNPLENSLPSMDIPVVPGAENIQQLTSGAQDLQQVIPTDLEGAGKLAESQLSKIDQVGELKDQLGDLPLNPMTSEEEAKKQLLNQAKEVAVDHFADQGEALKSAMDKISKYKQKFSSINSLSDITKRPPNPMKGKPLIERIVPGIQFQLFQKQGNFLTDFNLYAGYRVNGRLTTGLGWNQRVAYNLDRDKFNPNARVFGPRAFGEFKLGKGFSPRAEVEVMNTLIPSFVSSSRADNRDREWVVSGLVGIKKEYRFFKNIKGTTTLMLNVFHPRNKSPYPDWLNARFGFEFPLKKKIKRN